MQVPRSTVFKVSIALLICLFISFFAFKALHKSAPTSQTSALSNSSYTFGSSVLPQNQFSLFDPSSSQGSHLSTEMCQNIYRWVCQKRGDSHDPTGIVHPDILAIRHTLELSRQIASVHKDWDTQQVNEAIGQQLFDPKHRARIESAFKWVRHTMEHFIEQQPPENFTAIEKRQLKHRLRSIQLELPPPMSLYADEPDLITANEAFYERTHDQKMKLRVGGGYVFIAKSWFNLIGTLSHELAHSIDPCEIKANHLKFPAYDRLTDCFFKQGWIATPQNRSECGSKDQLSETFADWLSSFIVAEALAQFATEFREPQVINAARNSVRDLCDQEGNPDEELDTEDHPPPNIRIEKIFGKNPKIREILGCSVELQEQNYCNFDLRNP